MYKNIPFTARNEKLRDWSQEFKKLFKENKPTVPVLIHNNKPIFESLDIMEYLEEYTPSISKEAFRKWGDWSAKELRDAIQMYKYGQGGSPEQGKQQVLEYFLVLEEALCPNLTGEELALADFAVWPFVRQALRVEENTLEMGPQLQKWFTNIENHEKFIDLMKKSIITKRS